MHSRDEIGQVAAAFDDVHREAVRLAAEQALLRGNVNAMFTNLSRRSQGLIQRQLSLISELESREADPDQLSSLFKLDHLATRMRRNGENLLVLAGEEPGRRWTRPVPLVDVLRAAASEVEQYERIELTSVPATEVAGRVVNDLVHLLAELLENATSFSSPQTKVKVTGHALPDGRVLVEIHDTGIGLSPEDLAAINERLASPPTVDVSVSRRMGLFVVGRLSQRHGIRIQLRPSDSGGTTALVMLPVDVAQGGKKAAGQAGPGRSRGAAVRPPRRPRPVPRRPVAARPAAVPRSARVRRCARRPRRRLRPQRGQVGAGRVRGPRCPAATRAAVRAGRAARGTAASSAAGAPQGRPAPAVRAGAPQGLRPPARVLRRASTASPTGPPGGVRRPWPVPPQRRPESSNADQGRHPGQPQLPPRGGPRAELPGGNPQPRVPSWSDEPQPPVPRPAGRPARPRGAGRDLADTAGRRPSGSGLDRGDPADRRPSGSELHGRVPPAGLRRPASRFRSGPADFDSPRPGRAPGSSCARTCSARRVLPRRQNPSVDRPVRQARPGRPPGPARERADPGVRLQRFRRGSGDDRAERRAVATPASSSAPDNGRTRGTNGNRRPQRPQPRRRPSLPRSRRMPRGRRSPRLCRPATGPGDGRTPLYDTLETNWFHQAQDGSGQDQARSNGSGPSSASTPHAHPAAAQPAPAAPQRPAPAPLPAVTPPGAPLPMTNSAARPSGSASPPRVASPSPACRAGSRARTSSRARLSSNSTKAGPQVSRAPDDVRGRLTNLRRGIQQGRQAGTGQTGSFPSPTHQQER